MLEIWPHHHQRCFFSVSFSPQDWSLKFSLKSGSSDFIYFIYLFWFSILFFSYLLNRCKLIPLGFILPPVVLTRTSPSLISILASVLQPCMGTQVGHVNLWKHIFLLMTVILQSDTSRSFLKVPLHQSLPSGYFGLGYIWVKLS